MSHTRGNEEIFESAGDTTEKNEDNISGAPASAKQTSTDIETSHLVPSTAFEYFHGQIYDNKLSAYENMLRDSKNKARGEVSYSLADQLERSRGAESPFQRFARLKSEMGQLSSDLTVMTQEQTKSTDGKESKAEVSIWHTLQAETSSMLSQLSSLETPCREVCESQGLASKQHITTAGQLLALQQNQQQQSPEVSQESSHSSPTLTASASSSSSTGSAVDSAPLSRLEQRVYALELLLGVSSTTDMTSLIGGGAKTFPLLENLTSLERRVNLLDPVVLDVVSSKVSQLLVDLDGLNKAQSSKTKTKSGRTSSGNSSGNSGISDEQVAVLASGVASLEGFSDQLPALLLRLKTLAHVHQEASSFSARLTDLESSADELEALSQSNGEVMAALQEGFVSNMLTFKDNLAALDSRIDKLS